MNNTELNAVKGRKEYLKSIGEMAITTDKKKGKRVGSYLPDAPANLFMSKADFIKQRRKETLTAVKLEEAKAKILKEVEEEVEEESEKALSDLSFKELQERAVVEGVDATGLKSKADIISAIESA